MKNFSVIFDMDGVLVKSMSYVFDSLNLIISEHGYKIKPDDYTLYMGINTKKLKSLLKEQFDLEYSAEYLRKRTTELQIELIKKHETPSESLISLLKELRRNKITFGIGTSSPKERTFELLKSLGLLKYFDVIVNGDEIENHKPHPETFLKVAKKLNVIPEKCVVFEDAKNGIEAAKKANMKVIAIKTEFQNEKDLEMADLLINSFDEVNLKIIKELL